MEKYFSDALLLSVSRAISRRIYVDPALSLTRDDIVNEAFAHGLKLHLEGLPHEPAVSKILSHAESPAKGYKVWLYGRVYSHIRNLLSSRTSAPPQADIDLDSLALGGSSCKLDLDEDEVAEVCDRQSPLVASIIRRLAEGELIVDIAEDLGISPQSITRYALGAKK